MLRIILGVLLLSFTVKASAEFDSLITSGVNQIYNLQFEDAEKTFGTIKAKYPAHPAGKFFEAMILWWQILLDFDNTSYDEKFIDRIQETIDFCDEILDEDEENMDALFFKGGALGFRARLYAFRKNWVDAAMDGKDALPIVHRSYEINPDNVDVQLGFGIYNYYAAAIPERFPFIKPFMFMFPEGDIETGISQLDYAAREGKYSQIEAKYALTTLFLNFEKNARKAYPYAKSLHDEFPDNPNFHRYYAKYFVVANNYRGASKIYEDIISKVDSGKRGYSSWMKREAYYYLGMRYFKEKKAENAIKYFAKCLEVSRRMEKHKGDEKSGYFIFTLINLGRMYDTLGKTEESKKYYDEVLDLDEHRNSHEEAERRLEEPYNWGKRSYLKQATDDIYFKQI